MCGIQSNNFKVETGDYNPLTTVPNKKEIFMEKKKKYIKISKSRGKKK